MLNPVAGARKGSSFGVKTPDILGCFSREDDCQDASVAIREAIETPVKLMIEDGVPLPGGTDLKTCLDDRGMQVMLSLMTGSLGYNFQTNIL